MLNLTAQQAELFEWVKLQHGEQKRKYTGQPYWHHLEEVAKLIQDYTPQPDDRPTIEIAFCHDLLEDVEGMIWQVLREFLLNFKYTKWNVDRIVEGVIDLTDVYTPIKYPEFNRTQRKEREAIKLQYIPTYVKSVKYADLISNTSSIVKYDPGFARVYLSEKRHLLSLMKNGNFTLYAKAIQLLCNSEDLLNSSTTKLAEEDEEAHY